ncbi:putative periplasmic binding protein-like I [Helianthus annuus]|nr:glutamate receptor 2.5 [Helianthus annuus]KAJ0489702.1 putative periplasmic binding protein-like I [Helianthus annuus]KAJ0505619.1 putative periplasmic binding protein-like I [Helianthus annuus]KAJ0675283.1 putative periplasmic binding protein-like I [Helianthus annuus]KAJ0678581.1 putative periplasmic binding protein-like I [Helianthus annuus]KAJ0866889.1 putative periplasmic binding protein-like I [Helianthus annuus]
MASLVSHLSQAFRQTGSKVRNTLPLTSDSSSLDEELAAIKKQDHNAFLIHTSLELGVRLFQTAKKMEMTGDGYLWIATNGMTDLFHSINSTMISSLKGIVGVKTYFLENTSEFQHFRKRFHQKFISDYPEEEQNEPGIFAMQGYNSVRLLEKNFHKWKPISVTTVEIVNVIGKGYNSVYWTEGLGFSEKIEDDTNGATSIDNLGKALWPVQPWYADQGHPRNLMENSEKTMRVGIPDQSLFEQFVSVKFDIQKNEDVFDGFVVKVFDEMMRRMNQSYEPVRFSRSYDELVEAIQLKEFDAVAGDVTITEKRHKFVDFTQPYTESGLEMIVPVRSRLSNQPWLFLKPFTAEMWWLIAAITTYNGFVIWLIERSHNKSLQGPNIVTQIGIVFWLAFTSLFTLRGDKMHSNLSRMAIVVWLFVALVITQSYTASLASMLTAQRLEPTIASVDMLRNKNATVGYCDGSTIVKDYLVKVLRFEDIKTNSYNSTHGYAEALKTGEIAAIFLDVPAAKVFLAQYCKSFVRTGETFKVGGYGFAFARGSPKLADANKALMNVSESGTLKELEDRYINSEKCLDEESSPDENESLNLHSFSVLFVLTGGTSTVALAIYIIISINDFKKSVQEHTSLFQLISAFIKGWHRGMRKSSSIVALAYPED